MGMISEIHILFIVPHFHEQIKHIMRIMQENFEKIIFSPKPAILLPV